MDDTGNKHVTQSRTNAADSREVGEPLEILSGEEPIYTAPPDTQGARRLQMVTLGFFRNGTPVLHFRNYERTRGGGYRITREGAVFTLREFRDKIVTKVADLCARRPELTQDRAGTEGGR